MRRLNANTITNFNLMDLIGIKVLFTDNRIDRSSLQKGVYMYELSHSDEDWGKPVEINNRVLVNFYGTVLSTEKIEIPNERFGVDIHYGENFSYGGKDHLDLLSYVEGRYW